MLALGPPAASARLLLGPPFDLFKHTRTCQIKVVTCRGHAALHAAGSVLVWPREQMAVGHA